MGRLRVLCVGVLTVALILPASQPSFAAPPGSMGDAPTTWTDPECEVEGSPWSDTAACTPPTDQPDDDWAPNSCEGAVYCEMTYAELDAVGFGSADISEGDTTELGDADQDALQVAFENRQTASSSTYYDIGLVKYRNYLNSKCADTVRYNSHCGWLYHKFRTYDYRGYPVSTVRVTAYPARAGNNDPADKWVRSVGPLPGRYRTADGTSKESYRWGRMNGKFTGYEADSGSSFYPGKWRLDDWTVYKPGDSSVTRGNFEIHGGKTATGGSKLWSSITFGCIRLSIAGIKGLKSKWANRTDNRRSVKVYVRHEN